MRFLILFLTIFGVATLCQDAVAADQVPFGSQVNNVKNYNRANTRIATSGSISKGGVKELAEHGFKTIIDLRTVAEGVSQERISVEAAGMDYINIPVTGDGINKKQLAIFSEVIENTQAPMLLHCGSGNRVGAIWTTYRLSKGVDADIAFEEGRTAGMRKELEASVRSKCGSC